MVNEAIRKAEDSGFLEVEHRINRSDSTQRDVYVRGQRLTRDDKLHILAGMVMDVTERKKDQDRILASEARLKRAESIANIGSWEWDLVKGILHGSDQVYRIFNVSKDTFDVSYESFLLLVHPDDRPLVSENVRTALENHESYSSTHRILQDDGSVLYILECDADDRPIRMIGTCQDVTEKYLFEEKVSSLAKFPNENPNPVLRISRTLHVIYMNDAASVNLDGNCCQNSEITNQIFRDQVSSAFEVSDVYSFRVYIHDRHFEMMVTPVNVADYVNVYGHEITDRIAWENHATLLDAGLNATAHAVVITSLEGDIVWVNPAFNKITEYEAQEVLGKNPRVLKSGRQQDAFYDSMWETITQFHQVFLNMVINARDAMINGGKIKICGTNISLKEKRNYLNRSIEPGHYIRLDLSDTGSGIDSKNIDNIFEPFFTTKEPGKGTGLGLPTSLGIIDSHHGLIEVESELGKGTCFHIFLPAVDGINAGGQTHARMGRVVGHGETILLLDDEESIRKTMRQVLERHGYKVIVAKDGAEAVGIYANNVNSIQLVITDIIMPLMNGAMMARALLAIHPKAAILVASGYVGEKEGANLIDQLRQMGVHRILEKPFTAESLLQAVAQKLEENL